MVKHSPVSRMRSRPRLRGVCVLPVPVSTAAPVHVHWRCSLPPSRPLLLPVPDVYDVPVFKAVKVHRDFPRRGRQSAVTRLARAVDRALRSMSVPTVSW